MCPLRQLEALLRLPEEPVQQSAEDERLGLLLLQLPQLRPHRARLRCLLWGLRQLPEGHHCALGLAQRVLEALVPVEHLRVPEERPALENPALAPAADGQGLVRRAQRLGGGDLRGLLVGPGLQGLDQQEHGLDLALRPLLPPVDGGGLAAEPLRLPGAAGVEVQQREVLHGLGLQLGVPHLPDHQQALLRRVQRFARGRLGGLHARDERQGPALAVRVAHLVEELLRVGGGRQRAGAVLQAELRRGYRHARVGLLPLVARALVDAALGVRGLERLQEAVGLHARVVDGSEGGDLLLNILRLPRHLESTSQDLHGLAAVPALQVHVGEVVHEPDLAGGVAEVLEHLPLLLHRLQRLRMVALGQVEVAHDLVGHRLRLLVAGLPEAGLRSLHARPRAPELPQLRQHVAEGGECPGFPVSEPVLLADGQGLLCCGQRLLGVPVRHAPLRHGVKLRSLELALPGLPEALHRAAAARDGVLGPAQGPQGSGRPVQHLRPAALLVEALVQRQGRVGGPERGLRVPQQELRLAHDRQRLRLQSPVADLLEHGGRLRRHLGSHLVVGHQVDFGSGKQH
mmetsp:Transcript_120986/g.353501  ORF Transcript_120986/g.353501 Transcript_120986/m.353501 type:complete len:571 (-) Transcript_120986:201-1913(-)